MVFFLTMYGAATSVFAEIPLICDCKLFTKIRGLLFSAQLSLRGIPALYLFILFRFCHKHKIIKYNGSRRSSGEHRVRDKLQLLGAFAEEEPITSQCSAVHCRLVQCSAFAVLLLRRSQWRQKYNFYFFHELFVCFALSGVYYCLFASKFVLYFSTVFSPLNFPE